MFRFLRSWSCLGATRLRLGVAAALMVSMVVLATAPVAGARPHPSILSIPHGLKFVCGLSAAPGHVRCYSLVVTKPNSSVSLASASPPATAYSPGQIAHGYRFDLLGCGLTASSAAPLCGTGQTIAVVDAYHDPYIASDLATFDSQYNLPAPPSFQQVTPAGQAAPGGNSGWEEEIALDVEWVHAMAPGAAIILEEATDATATNLYGAVDDAVSRGANVVSMSWGGGESSGETTTDSHFANGNVTFIASAGDGGSQSDYPAASPDVVAVGGTSLTLDSQGTWQSETTWSCSSSLSCYFNGGTGGYTSPYEAEPQYQQSYRYPSGAQISTGGMRGYADVSYDADPNTGVAIYDTGQGGWLQIGGTSAGSPQWAALTAIAKSQGVVQIADSGVYGAAAGNAYTTNYHDITTGENGSCSSCYAGTGWDEPTGLGSPIANALVGALGGTSTGSPPPPPANDFSIATSPSSLTVQQGKSGTSTVSTSVTSGSAGSVALTVSGVPSGATASLNPTTVTAGGSSTLTVNAGSAAAGTYLLTVTGTEGTSTHSATVTLTVTRRKH